MTNRVTGDTSGAAGGPQAVEALAGWRLDPRLAGVRDADSLALLPKDEQLRWRELWADVTAAAPNHSANQAAPQDSANP